MLLIICLALPCRVFGGAWTLEKKHMYNRISFNYYRAEKNFDENGARRPMPNDGTFEDINIQWYQEFGLLNNLSLISSFYWKDLQYEDRNVGMSKKGVADIDLGLKLRLLKEPIVLSIQLLVKLPSGYDEHDDVALGKGQIDWEVRLLMGKSFYPLPSYLGLELGYRYRAEEPADEFKYLLEFGWSFSRRFSLRAKLDGTESIDNSDNIMDVFGNPTLTNEYNLGKLEITGSLGITEAISLEATYTSSLYGENTSVGDTLSFALVYNF